MNGALWFFLILALIMSVSNTAVLISVINILKDHLQSNMHR